MRRLTWLFLLGLFLVGCTCRSEKREDCLTENSENCCDVLERQPALKKALAIDVSKGSVEIPPGSTGDRIVNVSGPSTVYVLLKKQVIFAAHWPHSRTGTVTVHLDAISDGTHSLTIETVAGLIQDHSALKWTAAPNCTRCLKAAMYKCCL